MKNKETTVSCWNISQKYSFVWVLLAIIFPFFPLFLSVSQDVIGATVELPLWFRWEQFEKSGWEKVQNNTHKPAKIHLVTVNSLWVPFLSLITHSEAAGLGAQEWSRTWFTLGFLSDNKAGLRAARYPILHFTSASKSASRKCKF